MKESFFVKAAGSACNKTSAATDAANISRDSLCKTVEKLRAAAKLRLCVSA
jgi:hypothetical protein